MSHSPIITPLQTSVLAQRPFTLQFVLETVVPRGWTKPELLSAAYYTSTIWFMAYCFSIFSYLIVFQSHLQGHTNGQYRTGGTAGKDNAATIIFRIVVPIVLYTIAALFTRFWYLATRPPWAKPPPPAAVAAPPAPLPLPDEEPAPEPAPAQQPDGDYNVAAYNEYMQRMWQQYEAYMQQYQLPPPPPPAPPAKPEQAALVPRYALLPGQQQQNMLVPQAQLAEGVLGWGDEAHWALATAAKVPPPPLARWLDTNYIFLSSFGFIIATALQTTDVKTGCGVAAFIYLASIGLGLMLAQGRSRKVWVFFMEVAMCLVFLLQWAFTFPNGPNGGPSDREIQISRNFPFVTNGALGGVALVSAAEAEG